MDTALKYLNYLKCENGLQTEDQLWVEKKIEQLEIYEEVSLISYEGIKCC